MTYLSVAETVVHDIHEAEGAHRIAHNGSKLGAALWSLRFGYINQRKIRPFHYMKDVMRSVGIQARYLRIGSTYYSPLLVEQAHNVAREVSLFLA